MATKGRKHGLTKPDANGYYRPYIGNWMGKDQRFNLGKDQRAAEGHYHRIHDLYASCPQEWTEQALAFAKQIAAGEKPHFELPTTADPNAAHHSLLRHRKLKGLPIELHTQIEYAQKLAQTKQAYPSVATDLVAETNKLTESVAANSEFVAHRIEQLREELERLSVLAASSVKVPAKLTMGTLHEALDAYQADFETTVPRLPSGKLKQGDRKRRTRVANFKKAHADCPLDELDLPKLESIAAHWRNRPTLPDGERSSSSHAKNHLGEWFRFLTWLDNSPRYEWSAPKGIKSISRKIPTFQNEKKFSAVTKETYRPEQLAQLGKTATDFERLAIYLGLNCAMGAAELGRLVTSDFYLHQEHPFPRQLGITTTAGDSWLRYFRPKTEVFGEWILWPETVEMIEWAIERAKTIKSDLLFCRETGTPYYDDDSAKPDAAFANMWERCRKRSKVEKLLPFGSLRDTLPDYLRQAFDGGTELGSLCLTHGKPGIDELIDCYANRPWGRLHSAVRKSHDYFKPLWDEHISPKPF